jgi:hypothetical protein
MSLCTHRRGRNSEAVPSWPSRPNRPEPHVYSRPPSVMAALWYGPHETANTCGGVAATGTAALAGERACKGTRSDLGTLPVGLGW